MWRFNDAGIILAWTDILNRYKHTGRQKSPAAILWSRRTESPEGLIWNAIVDGCEMAHFGAFAGVGALYAPAVSVGDHPA